MSHLGSFQLANAGIHLLLALVWGMVAQSGWRFRRQHQSRFFRMLPLLASAVAFNYGVFTLTALLPADVHQWSRNVLLLYAVNDCNIFMVVALARHLSRYFPTPEQPPPGLAWLATNYGSALLMWLLNLIYVGFVHVDILPPQFPAYRIVRVVYQLVMLGLIVWHLLRIARPGVWRAGGGSWVARRADVVVMIGALVGLGSWLLIILATTRYFDRGGSIWIASTPTLVLDTITGVGFAIPLAVRTLGAVIRGVLLSVVMLAATYAVYIGTHQLATIIAAPQLQPLLELFTVLAFVVLLVPGHAWAGTAIDHVVFRRRQRQREELQAFLRTLSPEVGIVECCRRALPRLSHVMRLRGAAILLNDGEAVAHGNITLAGVERLKDAGIVTHVLQPHASIGYNLRDLPESIVEALGDSDVVGGVPLTSPRRRWGLLLVSAGLLGAAFSEEDEQVLRAFANQLALVLDGAELLARAVAVERSLAHNEKLAAIGELAARIAHEIRNPVTAARSLAQQLARDPVSPLNAEHAQLILSELERVERQVAALLRFARRDEFRFAPADLAALARGTMEQFRSQLQAHAIDARVDAATEVTTPIDRDKMRQVLINLVENAMDALRAHQPPRQLTVAVAATSERATICVTDNGPGVPSEALPHLFEPFFSLKANGTGLGLAIAKRTIDAHGGQIEVTSSTAGTHFRIDLPLVRPDADHSTLNPDAA